MNVAEYRTQNLSLVSWIWFRKDDASAHPAAMPQHPSRQSGIDIFKPLRRWVDNIEVHEPKLAHRLCQMIPSQCPFERDVKVAGITLLHIPPLCKLNPLYEEVVGLRFRALCYLADECGEDVTRYC